MSGTDRGRTLTALALVAGLLLVASSALALWRSQSVAEFGPPQGFPAATTAPADPTEVTITDGRATAQATGRQAPAWLAIPALDVTAEVDQVGIEPKTGQFAVPPSVDRVGWYRYGPGLEAEAGSIVIAGHVDGADQGPGAFFELGELAEGDQLRLTDERGTPHEFTVVARTVYDKREIPLADYFARDGEPRLTLITCGGPFDPDAQSYRDNVVVTAVPVR